MASQFDPNEDRCIAIADADGVISPVEPPNCPLCFPDLLECPVCHSGLLDDAAEAEDFEDCKGDDYAFELLFRRIIRRLVRQGKVITRKGDDGQVLFHLAPTTNT